MGSRQNRTDGPIQADKILNPLHLLSNRLEDLPEWNRKQKPLGCGDRRAFDIRGYFSIVAVQV